MKATNFLAFLTSILAVPAVMLFSFHLLLYGFQPQVPAELQDAGRWIWNYLLHDPVLGLPDTDMLDMRGRHHMLDVKRILVQVRHVWWGITAAVFLLLLLQAGQRNQLAQALRWAGYIGLGTLLASILLATLNFRWAFIMFHYLLFTEQNWIFPADSLLIRLFPLDYFQQFFIYWGCCCVAGFLLMLLWGRFLAKEPG